MENLKKIGICTLFLIFFALFANEALSLGVAPARKIIEFEPNKEHVFDLKIYNSGGQNVDVVLYLEGKMKDYVSISQDRLSFSSSDDFKTVSYKVRLPNSFDVPGDHIANLVIREVPPDSDAGGTVIGSSVAVVHQIVFKFPYPGKYVVADLEIVNSNRRGRVDFVVEVNNLGEDRIDATKGLIDVYDMKAQKVVTLETDLKSVGSRETVGLGAVWDDENVAPGKYRGELILTYDGNVAYDTREFYVGRLFVDIIDIVVENFRLGEIAKFVIVVDNQWPEPIDSVYTEFIFSDLGEEVAVVKSASETIDALFKGELVAYWDTKGVEEGVYDTKINLYYDDQKVEKDMQTYVGVDSIKFDLFGGAVVASTEGLDKLDLAIVSVIVLILLNIGVVIYFKKFRK